MKKTKTNLMINLQLFAEGAGADAGGSEGSGANGEVAAFQGTGVNAQAAAEQTMDVNVDRNAEFEKLIKGEYKEQFDARMQDTIKQRLKGTKETVEKYNSLAPTLELLSQRYGVDVGNIEALNKAIEEDNSFYEDEALRLGIPVEELKKMRKMERENEMLRKERDERKAEEHAARERAQKYSKWVAEESEAKKVYPSLSLDEEAKNPKFFNLINAGVDVKTAFEVVHRDEMIPTAMQFASERATQKVANSIRANGARPVENGNASQSATVSKTDPSKLSSSEFEEIRRRVRAGEKITFG